MPGWSSFLPSVQLILGAFDSRSSALAFNMSFKFCDPSKKCFTPTFSQFVFFADLVTSTDKFLKNAKIIAPMVSRVIFAFWTLEDFEKFLRRIFFHFQGFCCQSTVRRRNFTAKLFFFNFSSSEFCLKACKPQKMRSNEFLGSSANFSDSQNFGRIFFLKIFSVYSKPLFFKFHHLVRCYFRSFLGPD